MAEVNNESLRGLRHRCGDVSQTINEMADQIEGANYRIHFLKRSIYFLESSIESLSCTETRAKQCDIRFIIAVGWLCGIAGMVIGYVL